MSVKPHCFSNILLLEMQTEWQEPKRDYVLVTYRAISKSCQNVMTSPANLPLHIDRFKLEIRGDICPEQLKKVVTALEQLR